MRAFLLVSLIACGGTSKPPRDVPKLETTPTGCEPNCVVPAWSPAEIREARFEPPDSERSVGETTNATPPEPTCRLAAEALASIDLGNYADEETRAPRVAAHEQRCKTAKLSRMDRECLADARTKNDAAYCVPAWYPDVKNAVVTSQQCDGAERHMRTVMSQHMQANPAMTDAEFARLSRQIHAAIASCKQDRWNAQLLQCATYYVPFHSQSCAYTQPNVMWRRLQDRLERANRS